jgi:hypothetical protein
VTVRDAVQAQIAVGTIAGLGLFCGAMFVAALWRELFRMWRLR